MGVIMGTTFGTYFGIKYDDWTLSLLYIIGMLALILAELWLEGDRK